jgi:hypothetical protein
MQRSNHLAASPLKAGSAGLNFFEQKRGVQGQAAALGTGHGIDLAVLIRGSSDKLQ